MSLARAFNTDRDLEENGKWFNDVLGDKSGVDLCIRRMSSEAVTKVQQELAQANRYRMKEGKFPEEVANEILIETLARGVIVDWRGVTDDDNNPVDYSPEVAIDYLTKLRDFRLLVTGLANNMDAYRKGVEADISKN
jgi:hypothetical protein